MLLQTAVRRHCSWPLRLLPTLLVLLLSTSPATADDGANQADAPAQSLAEKLARRITVNFSRATLGEATLAVSQQTGLDIRIMGMDLGNSGISTGCNSFPLDERDRPAGDVLQSILTQMNPDGKLVLVAKQEEGNDVLYVTTRYAAEKRGDPILESPQQ